MADDLLDEQNAPLSTESIESLGKYVDAILLVSQKKLIGHGGKAGRILLQGLKDNINSH